MVPYGRYRTLTLFHKLPSEIIPDLAPQRIFGATARLKKKKKKEIFHRYMYHPKNNNHGG